MIFRLRHRVTFLSEIDLQDGHPYAYLYYGTPEPRGHKIALDG